VGVAEARLGLALSRLLFTMHGSAQPEDQRFPSASAKDAIAEGNPPLVRVSGTIGDRSNGNRSLAETELESALQLLVERAQYITGATGTALALPQGDEMVCRASAGSSAPPIGARLQVRSGLTGESIARRQLLRCDNAENDPRVNLETCRALGIASIVVLPLLRRDGEVRGLFELFSDHPYAFEERDLIALERMAALTLTALDLAEQRQSSEPSAVPRAELKKPVEPSAEDGECQISVVSVQPEVAKPELVEPLVQPAQSGLADVELANRKLAPPSPVETVILPVVSPIISPASPAPSFPAPSLEIQAAPVSAVASVASVPEAMLRVQKCASCGFPVSEGRALCLDCERKNDNEKKELEKQRKKEAAEAKPDNTEQGASAEVGLPAAEEFVPAFLANAKSVNESWLANHVNLLAVAVLILCILVAVVVFR
jgi:putative methionine-R-sulfoxide reductase with GAF domain